MTRRETLSAMLIGAAGALGAGPSRGDGGETRVEPVRDAIRGPLFNQDSTDFFFTRSPDEMTGEGVDAWVDRLAAAGVGTVVTCVCAMCTNYASGVWESHWGRCDPDDPSKQGAYEALPPESAASARKWVAAMKRLDEAGVHFHERAYARCRRHGLGAWASIRMNDVHDCDLSDSPLLSSFYIDQRARGLLRVPHRLHSWTDRALDWGRQEVRDHYMALVREVLGFRGIEGLELDWMRFGWHFGIGREAEGGEILTGWIREVRSLCRRASGGRRSPIRLGCRVPSTPDAARMLGLDGARWAREGLIDLLVVTPFWATCEFAMPMATWKRLLEGTGCTLAGGLEVRYQPIPGGPFTLMTPELARGAAAAVLAGGADQVYLFNYFGRGQLDDGWTEPVYERTLASMRDLPSVLRTRRRHGVTYRDTVAPGEAYAPPLPASGSPAFLRLPTGPAPGSRAVEALIELDAADGAEVQPPELRANGVPCGEPSRDGTSTFIYPIPPEALGEGDTVLEVTLAGGRVVRAEVAIDG